MPKKTVSNSVAGFYDEFSKTQIETGINIRHYSILNKLKKAGLKKHHHILEIGCGIGTLTGLVGKYLSNGKLTALDISPESIEVARKRCRHLPNISFGVSDMSSFENTEKFDFIIFPDVLEHIPAEQHNPIFKLVSKNLKNDGKIAIHIPDPIQLDLLRAKEPQSLQIIDQSLYIQNFATAAADCNLVLDLYERYRLYSSRPDYNWILFSVKEQLDNNPKQNKALLKIKELYWRFLG
ncbi:MAG: class I SAM-dependent methyltransferase [Bacteroidia bacterium]